MSTQRILVAVDFSPPCRVALREADALAMARGGSLTLLSVQPVASIAVMDFVYAPSPDQVGRLVEAAAAQLTAWSRELSTPAARVHTEVVLGDPAGEIVKKSGEFDLIVMATHGHTGFARLVLGSVTERVVRLAKCSVLVVRPPPP